jgi:hypothetical protein
VQAPLLAQASLNGQVQPFLFKAAPQQGEIVPVKQRRCIELLSIA